jgi:translation initiation factor eIF-2B subunit epsilon
MRELDQQDVIWSDFILLRGDIVSNISLKPALKEHFLRKENKDCPCVLTKVFTKIHHSSPIRAPKEDIILITEWETNELLKYQNLENGQAKVITQGCDFENGGDKQFEVLTNMLDCDIDICSPEILRHFTEDFNIEHLKDGFINNIIESEIIGDQVHFHQVEGPFYFSKVCNPYIYLQTTKDILNRHAYPLVLEKCLLAPKSNSTLLNDFQTTGSQKGSYKEENVSLDLTSERWGFFVLGRDAKVGPDTLIENSTIGRKCIIGKNVRIINSIIWHSAEIGDNCTIMNSIIGHKVKIGPGMSGARGSIICSEVIIKEGSDLPDHSVIGHLSFNAATEKYQKIEETNENYFESGAFCFLHSDHQLQNSERIEFEGEEQDSDESSLVSIDDEIFDSDQGDNFEEGIIRVINASFELGYTVENTKTEINSLKFSENKNFTDCLRASLPIIFVWSLESNPDAKGKSMMTLIQSIVLKWGPMIKDFSYSDIEMRELIKTVEEVCIEQERLQSVFHIIIQSMF